MNAISRQMADIFQAIDGLPQGVLVDALIPRPAEMSIGEGSKAKSTCGHVATGEFLPENIGVVCDWDKLKAVMVGIPDNDVLPAWYPNWKDPEGNEVDGPPGQTKA